jgi:bacterioferritin
MSLISQFTVPDTTEGIVQGDLDPESHMLIHDILDKDRDHVHVLKQLTH